MQPFPTLIAAGFKTIETRKWPTDHRGDLLICAGKKPHPLYRSYDHRTSVLELNNDSAVNGYLIPENFKPLYAEGEMVCVVNLFDVRPMTIEDEDAACCDFYHGAYSWVFDNVRLVEIKPIKGQLGLFNVDNSLIKYL